MPRQQRLNQIADFFEVSADYLLGRETPIDSTPLPGTFKISLESLMDANLITVDGKAASKREIEGAITFIRTLRTME